MRTIVQRMTDAARRKSLTRKDADRLRRRFRQEAERNYECLMESARQYNDTPERRHTVYGWLKADCAAIYAIYKRAYAQAQS